MSHPPQGIELEPAGRDRWRVPPIGDMRVPGIVFASDALLPDVSADRSLQQIVNVATLPGIVTASYAMPDVHWGYGFPIGGVVSPGGVGFDISCGVRLLVCDVDEAALAPRRSRLLDELGRATPTGLGPGGSWRLDRRGLQEVLAGGARYAVEQGHGEPDDLLRCEDGGVVEGVDVAAVSDRALERGLRQVGSLGSGNHFVEVQVVDRVDDADTAAAFGLREGTVCVMVHTGSRGLGHQICTDHVAAMEGAMAHHGITVPDRQLACAPVGSREGRAYLGAMAAAANYGRANRQLLTQQARAAFVSVGLDGALRVLYDVSHNLAKLEEHPVDGGRRQLCVHRKGATRALPPGHADLPPDLAPWGQPVLVPGSMGTGSYVLVGAAGNEAFASACHGAGRTMSRHAARKRVRGAELRSQLESGGVAVRARSMRGLAEEAPEAYKDVDEVVATCERAGLATRVARMRPVGVVKG